MYNAPQILVIFFLINFGLSLDFSIPGAATAQTPSQQTSGGGTTSLIGQLSNGVGGRSSVIAGRRAIAWWMSQPIQKALIYHLLLEKTDFFVTIPVMNPELEFPFSKPFEPQTSQLGATFVSVAISQSIQGRRGGSKKFFIFVHFSGNFWQIIDFPFVVGAP